MIRVVKTLSLLLLTLAGVLAIQAADTPVDPADPFSNGSNIEIRGTAGRATDKGTLVQVTAIKGKPVTDGRQTYAELTEEMKRRNEEAKRKSEDAKKRAEDARAKREGRNAGVNRNGGKGTAPEEPKAPKEEYRATSRTILVVDLKGVAVGDPLKLKLYPTNEIKNGIRCFTLQRPEPASEP